MGSALPAVACAIAGYLALTVPWWAAVFVGRSTAPNMIDGMQPESLLLLGLVGLAYGVLAHQRFWLGGVFSMSLFPLIAVWDVVRDPTSHNLLPLEFLIYGALTVPGILGGLAGRAIVSLRRRGRNGTSR